MEHQVNIEGSWQNGTYDLEISKMPSSKTDKFNFKFCNRKTGEEFLYTEWLRNLNKDSQEELLTLNLWNILNAQMNRNRLIIYPINLFTEELIHFERNSGLGLN